MAAMKHYFRDCGDTIPDIGDAAAVTSVNADGISDDIIDSMALKR